MGILRLAGGRRPARDRLAIIAGPNVSRQRLRGREQRLIVAGQRLGRLLVAQVVGDGLTVQVPRQLGGRTAVARDATYLDLLVDLEAALAAVDDLQFGLLRCDWWTHGL